jgi:hypothetical protein
MTSTEAQSLIHNLLQQLFGADVVKSEWSVRLGATDVFGNRALYAPRLDVAVGPFNSTRERAHEDALRIVAESKHKVIQQICGLASGVHNMFVVNNNPRCLLAVEIEFSGSSKHILGDFANASMMGLVGVVVASDHNFPKVQRVGEYARAVRSVRKAPSDLFANTICLTVEEFIALLRKNIGVRGQHRN